VCLSSPTNAPNALAVNPAPVPIVPNTRPLQSGNLNVSESLLPKVVPIILNNAAYLCLSILLPSHFNHPLWSDV